tara:strand:- start:29059 stop:31293 length:2235 start_codon:yes stop_codon:yes gene_type:complete
MNQLIRFNLLFIVSVFLQFNAPGQGVVSELRSQGYTIFPAPQNVDLRGRDIVIDHTWKVLASGAVSRSISDGLTSRATILHGLDFKGNGTGSVELRISKDAVGNIPDPERSKQAYKITIQEGKVVIEGQGEVGLFYGVQSFLQLIKPIYGGKFQLPEGTITDWPDLEMRFVHWDTKHHQAKLETLKRYIDWLAYFKVNAIAFEIEDKYEYPSHPIIGAPNAFTKAEMHELTQYALERHIQLVPNVQAPSHMAFVLKHKEFEHLRADGSNYHICMCDEEAMELIFDMYQDMIDATPGVDYFFVSTDEVYYAGICGKCKLEYNDKNRSQTWVSYLQRVNKWMNKRGRRVLAWVEYPLLPEDISEVPNNVIDAIMGTHKNSEWTINETKAGIDQLAYSSMQGSEYLFPNYFPTTYRDKKIEGRLYDAYNTIPERLKNGANLIGTFAAAWDDAGLHSETFWLGWATVTQYAWTMETPSLNENIVDFIEVYYGVDSPGLLSAYVLLEEGARFYESMWDKVPTKEREKGYGSSYGKGIGGDFKDLLIQPPPLPASEDLHIKPFFREKYGQKMEEAMALVSKNDQLIFQLLGNLKTVKHNRYNLEVYLSIAYLERYAMNTIIQLGEIEDVLVRASKVGIDKSQAIDLLIQAHSMAEKILREQDEMWAQLTFTWEKSRLMKGASANGKDFYHEFDDVKDHFADRRKGLEYMLAPFERIGLPAWKDQLATIIKEYAKAHNIPVKALDAKRLED